LKTLRVVDEAIQNNIFRLEKAVYFSPMAAPWENMYINNFHPVRTA